MEKKTVEPKRGIGKEQHSDNGKTNYGSRKFVLYLITATLMIGVILFSSFRDIDLSSLGYIVTLFGIYAAGNVGTKVASTFNPEKKDEGIESDAKTKMEG